ncbi:MAG: GNAT family N-acetyltransferase [Ruminococcus sp.]|nr:GNAT family N-acetyltransferase [Ruminococcus sp.]
MELRFEWTDGNNEDFARFYRVTEDYYSALVGGEDKRKGFIPYNLSSVIEDVLVVYAGEKPAACAGIKAYSEKDAEIKRVWVEPGFRKNHIASQMMALLEEKAKRRGFSRLILQTREIMPDAVGLYTKLGYHRIGNYPPYDKLEGAVCFAKEIKP